MLEAVEVRVPEVVVDGVAARHLIIFEGGGNGRKGY